MKSTSTTYEHISYQETTSSVLNQYRSTWPTPRPISVAVTSISPINSKPRGQYIHQKVHARNTIVVPPRSQMMIPIASSSVPDDRDLFFEPSPTPNAMVLLFTHLVDVSMTSVLARNGWYKKVFTTLAGTSIMTAPVEYFPWYRRSTWYYGNHSASHNSRDLQRRS